MANDFKFQIGQIVSLKSTGEPGEVVEQKECGIDDDFLIRHKAGDGSDIETWMSEDALMA